MPCVNIVAKESNRKDLILGEFFFQHCKLMAKALPLSSIFGINSYPELLFTSLGLLVWSLGAFISPKILPSPSSILQYEWRFLHCTESNAQ